MLRAVCCVHAYVYMCTYNIAKCIYKRHNMFLQNYIVIVLFGLSFLSGGIANVVFTTDNGDLRSDLCDIRGFSSPGSGICRALDRVVATEAASGVS